MFFAVLHSGTTLISAKSFDCSIYLYHFLFSLIASSVSFQLRMTLCRWLRWRIPCWGTFSGVTKSGCGPCSTPTTPSLCALDSRSRSSSTWWGIKTQNILEQNCIKLFQASFTASGRLWDVFVVWRNIKWYNLVFLRSVIFVPVGLEKLRKCRGPELVVLHRSPFSISWIIYRINIRQCGHFKQSGRLITWHESRHRGFNASRRQTRSTQS